MWKMFSQYTVVLEFEPTTFGTWVFPITTRPAIPTNISLVSFPSSPFQFLYFSTFSFYTFHLFLSSHFRSFHSSSLFAFSLSLSRRSVFSCVRSNSNTESLTQTAFLDVHIYLSMFMYGKREANGDKERVLNPCSSQKVSLDQKN